MFRQETARRFAGLSRVVLICGRYEGVDERVAEHLATDEISIGDFVLSGGELAAAMILDAVTRLIPGALGNEDSIVNESFSEGAARGGAGTACRAATTPASDDTTTIAGFWIIRITRGRLRFGGGMCRKYCWAGITRRYASGGGVAHWRRLGGIGRNCWMGLGWARRIGGCWMRSCAVRRNKDNAVS